MRFNFKKIASAASSALMIGSTVALAAAANYPAPFVSGDTANVAIVVGESATLDNAPAAAISADLGSRFAANGGGSSTTTTTTTGEVFPLFTSGTEIYLNDTLNVARTALSEDELPTLLADGDFSGNVDADFTQSIVIPSNSRLLFGQQPTSNDDPTIFVSMGTGSSTTVYNTTITFDQAVALNNTESEGESLTLFGKEWTVGADTDGDTIVLYQSSERIALALGGSNPIPSSTVTVEGSTYTVELVAASDTAATVRVTDSSGVTQTKEINEDDSKKVNGLEVAVAYADESEATGTASAEITVGSNKITLENNQNVKMGSDEENLDETLVSFNGGSTGVMTKLTIQVFEDDSDEDALVEGGSKIDPVWGSFKLDFSEVNAPFDSSDRETITVEPAGDDRMKIAFTDHNGDDASFEWLNNQSQTMRLAYGNDAKEVIKVQEKVALNRSNYVVVGNQDEGYLLKLSTVSNSSSDTNDDIIFTNVFDTSKTYKASISSEGAGTVTVGGKTYTVAYVGASTDSQAIQVRLSYPDSTGDNVILFPTIETEKGAKVAFYEPQTNFSLGNYDGLGNKAAGLIFPDGDDYATTADVILNPFSATNQNFSIGGTNVSTTASATVTVGRLTYNFTQTGVNRTSIYLLDPVNGGNIVKPAVIIFEEEEDRTDNEEALVVEVTGGGTSAAETEVDTVVSTATTPPSTSGNGNSFITLETNDDLSQMLTLYGTLVTKDTPTSGQTDVSISYPDDQVQAMVYIAEGEAVIGGGGSLGNLVITDSQISTVSSKNLIVVGGSCINTAAKQLLGGSASCGPSFTSATTVGAGQFLIQSFNSPWSSGKVALLVAGYNADDTANAATYLRTQTVDTAAGMKYVGTTATSATLVAS